MQITLTEKQITVLRFFRDYHREHGIAPTLEEAAQALGVSKITVYEHLNNLQKKGAIHRDKAKARAVSITYDPDAGPPQEAPLPGLPVLGSIAAGRPIEAIEDREEVAIDELVPIVNRTTGEDNYLLRVRGKSMIEDHIDDGDLVVVERRQTASNGDIVVAILEDEEATLKRFYREGERIKLQPANSSMEPIFPDKIQIRGVVRGVIRRFS
ncbi:MAG: transcriptional repressor LexA [Planctomycetota bacterium]|jgi:repressor LexA|nr:transcriptional repressor LexA [Planctomycetota bacterium]